MDEIVKKWVRKNFIFHAITLALYPFWWKFYWLSENNFKFSILESQSWKNKIVTKREGYKDGGICPKLLTISITNFNFFNCPVNLQRNLKLIFRLKFNHGFTSFSYFTVLFEKLYTIKKSPGGKTLPIFLLKCSK